MRIHRRPRGLEIVPKPFAGSGSSEVHDHSCIFPSVISGKILVVEWTGKDSIDRHVVDC